MKNTELQLLVYGKDIARSELTLEYPNVWLKQAIRTDSPNYLFVYLEVGKEAKPGTLRLTFTEGKKKLTKAYELKARATTVGAQGFGPTDVMYLIMPDRFANGNPANDAWGGDTANRRDPIARHGGDLAGIEQRLDYINELGVTAIWLNPVLENRMPEASYHGYATTDFYKVDTRLGSNEDYCRVIEKTHQKGMKIVMDMIFNHCGSSHWWMNDLPCRDWLNHQDGFVPTTHDLYTVMDIHAPESEKIAMTDGWFVPAMPDLNQRNTLLSDYLIQNSIWWIEYARIDGIRHDTHPYADFGFLARWNKRVLEEYPTFNIVGESWYISSTPLSWWQYNSKLNDRQTNLKTIMDFNLMTACSDAFAVNPTEKNPLRKIYEVIAQDFTYEDTNNILIFLDNHDTNRFPKVGEPDLRRFKQAVTLLLTTRGIPQLYYGTEILMTGEKSEGDGMLRKDFPGGWPGDSVNAFTAEGRTALQNEAHAYLQKLLQWRKTSKAVCEGKLLHYAPNWQTECYVYARVKDSSKVLVILNGSDSGQSLPVERFSEVVGSAASGKDIISGKTVSLGKEIAIPAKGILVLEL